MKWLNDHRMRLMLVGVVAAIVFGGESTKADFTFGEPTNLGPTVNSHLDDANPKISCDGLALYFSSKRSGGYGDWDLWVTTRRTTNHSWEEPLNLGPTVNSTGPDHSPAITSDGLELYFCSTRPGGYGKNDIWMTKRHTIHSSWSQPTLLEPPANGPTNAWGLSISPDGLQMFFVAGDIPGTYGGPDIWMTTRTTKNAKWSEPVNLGPTVNSPGDLNWEYGPAISPDGLVLMFASSRDYVNVSLWNFDMWLTRRETKGDTWGEPINLGLPVNTPYSDISSSISADGCALYFHDRYQEGLRPGGCRGEDLWQTPIIPILDFNADGIVDTADMCIMVDHWGENYSLCDIGPMPWGDGVVNVEDLKVLAKHMGGYQQAIAHWTLDEKDGNTAHDKIGENNAAVYGDAMWFPTEGMFGGALLLDGTDDWAFTYPVRQLRSGSFSIVGWIKGWSPGQVIISQATASNLLMTDAEGNLISEIKSVGRAAGPLLSETIITDGNWHRIAFVWDGSQRKLYVDGALVAEDTRAGLEISDMGLNFGVGKDYEPETHWSGFLDDVRIYDVALKKEQIAALTQ